jgi:hypothetical protein
MNERIQELYMQAIQYADSVVPAKRRYNDIYYAIASAKHAELIVKECAEIVKDSPWKLGNSYAASDQAWLIKEHFGVEE